jgi:hypothetical protein
MAAGTPAVAPPVPANALVPAKTGVPPGSEAAGVLQATMKIESAMDEQRRAFRLGASRRVQFETRNALLPEAITCADNQRVRSIFARPFMAVGRFSQPRPSAATGRDRLHAAPPYTLRCRRYTVEIVAAQDPG